jgi:hypothetical protein
MWNESIEEPVEDTSGEESIDVTDSEPVQVEIISMITNRYVEGGGLQVLTAYRDAGRAPSCYDDVVDKARERRRTADQECSNGTPIRSKFGRIAVDTMEPVHVGYGYIAPAHNEVAVKSVSRISM